MMHVLYVDLSAKVEHWAKDSAVAVSNDHARVYLVRGKAKQKARMLIKSLHGSKSARYRMLAVLVYLAVKDDLQRLNYIVIDQDYAGGQAEATIKNLLLTLLHRNRSDITARNIRFAEVRGSKADKLAKQVYDGKVKPDRTVDFSELEPLIRG